MHLNIISKFQLIYIFLKTLKKVKWVSAPLFSMVIFLQYKEIMEHNQPYFDKIQGEFFYLFIYYICIF